MSVAALFSLWWVWLALAIVLAILEVLVSGFFFLGFAGGAAAVAVLVLLPIDLGLAALLAAFAVLSLIAWGILRRIFRAPDGQVRIIRDDVNK